jgi:hypothetical protein
MSRTTGGLRVRGFPRSAAVTLGVCALLGVLAAAALATEAKLTIGRASEKAGVFAESTCKRDDSCVRSGVLNCDRRGDLVVHCRIFDERRTEVQGKYRCSREIRMVMDPVTHRTPVNGLGRWSCPGGGAPG